MTIDPGIPTECQRCGYTWRYRGRKSPGAYAYTTCPECGTTVKVGNRGEAPLDRFEEVGRE